MNSATNALRLLFSNHEPSYDLVKLLALTAWEEAPQHENVPKIWTREQCARFKLADQIKAMVERQIGSANSVKSVLLRAAFDDVEWEEIADDFLEEYERKDSPPAEKEVG